jgi:hypothetical protein
MTEIDFTGFLLAHKCMRREYSRLAEAARHPRGVRHQALIEEHIAVTLSVLHHHHAEEDNWLWPTLRERAPAARPSLDRLEAQHTQLDSLPMRAPVFAELHEAINAHFDEEEQLILPLGTAHVSAENGRLSVSGHSRRSSAGTCRSCWAGCLAKRRPRADAGAANAAVADAYPGSGVVGSGLRQAPSSPLPRARQHCRGGAGIRAASNATLLDLASDIEVDVVMGHLPITSERRVHQRPDLPPGHLRRVRSAVGVSTGAATTTRCRPPAAGAPRGDSSDTGAPAES